MHRADNASVAEGAHLRIATFNIRHGAPRASYRGLPDKLADACAGFNANVLGLQEVDVGVPRSQHADLAKVVAEACGMAYYFAKARQHAGRGQYGNAVLVRGSIHDVEVVPLAGDHRHTITIGALRFKPLREPRNVIIATVNVGGHRLSIGTGHLATDSSARPTQLSEAAARLAARPAPRVLFGDFNIPWRQAAELLQPYRVKLAEQALSRPDPVLQTGIDHVAVDGVTVEHVETRWLPVSDHRAKIAEVVLAIDTRDTS
jgi:endonuclease/exonuclease/phosphatase family metal-dependent hydrolase